MRNESTLSSDTARFENPSAIRLALSVHAYPTGALSANSNAALVASLDSRADAGRAYPSGAPSVAIPVEPRAGLATTSDELFVLNPTMPAPSAPSLKP